MKYLPLALIFVSLFAKAEIGIDVGFRFNCTEASSLKLTAYVGAPEDAKSDPSIVMEPSTRSCTLGDYRYDLVLRPIEATGYGAGGGQRTLSIDLSINDKPVFKFANFANQSVDSIEELVIEHGKYVSTVKVCGRDSLEHGRRVDGCVSLYAKYLAAFDQPTSSPMEGILTYSPK